MVCNGEWKRPRTVIQYYHVQGTCKNGGESHALWLHDLELASPVKLMVTVSALYYDFLEENFFGTTHHYGLDYENFIFQQERSETYFKIGTEMV